MKDRSYKGVIMHIVQSFIILSVLFILCVLVTFADMWAL